ncbi:hypothetical protein HBI56_113970 [Parastagonospora nodorum]|nr:hypothetical protein HBH56_194830 [Parastagonospora nodorum]KAH3924822.1 hypothetical protein HBH54_188660 [Parastagonospora nodorum]KAH3953323.1 hypothetical protein HBH53_040800 [Parastagonospora nodorum]KAH3976431.1 hypothetical protein HBH52_117690 [Parastagonospora nodorum]KAH3984305.1 hypothetical protein HBH51_030950 [Parastagonospora nodorum]
MGPGGRIEHVGSSELLVLTQGRYLSGEDYERLVTAFPGTNLNGVRIKCSRFRVEQRNLYEELGWALPDGGAVKKTPSKRGADDQGEGTPTKKPRAKKGKGKKDEVVKSDEGEGDAEPGDEVVPGVKEEQIDDGEA